MCTKCGEDRFLRFGEIILTRIDRNVYGDSHVKKEKWGANLGTHLKMIKYGMDNICAKFGEFARI